MPTSASVCPSAVELRLERIDAAADLITVHAAGRRRRVPCPLCGAAAERVHSRYTRTLADLPWAGTRVRLVATVRRFFCDAAGCARRIFGERLPRTAERYARRTRRAASALELIGFALGRRAAARLGAALGLPAGPGAVLRCVGAPVVAERPTPRVLGVDDWAWRKGQTYGTILVDLERRHVVDLLPGRAAPALAAWLRAHPGVEIVSRDRGGEYAEAVRMAAPEAVQVADRFHLLRNLVDAVASGDPSASSSATPRGGASRPTAGRRRPRCLTWRTSAPGGSPSGRLRAGGPTRRRPPTAPAPRPASRRAPAAVSSPVTRTL